MSIHDEFILQDHWERIGVRHHHGILIPLSSIYTEHSAGIGEIHDLIPLIEWLPRTGFSLLQLLPINDTGNDPSPYMAISAYALNPIYISLSALPGITALSSFQQHRPRLEQMKALDRVQYHEVLEKKLDILREYIFQGEGKQLIDSPPYTAFVEQEKEWLLPYALFRALKTMYGFKAWWHFPEYAERPSSCEKIASLRKDIQKEMLFWICLQYIACTQWKKVREACKKNNVLLMGDLPILVNKDSADVWWNPELFSLDMNVGAPPDMYSKEGQLWGFPLYRWDRHKRERYQWFQKRLHLQEKLYDLYRIDHIVGLFRLWAVPPGKSAKEGHFVPKDPDAWQKQGEALIHILAQATTMLPIGEDLGDIPDIVRASMHKLGIPGVKVLRWERNWKIANHSEASFIPPSAYSPESLATVSTHDSSTLEGWWNEDPHAARLLCSNMGLSWEEKLSYETRLSIMKLCHRAQSLFHINLLQEYTAFVPSLSWNDCQFDRINVPGTVSDMNWSWKSKVPVEVLIDSQELLELLQELSQSRI